MSRINFYHSFLLFFKHMCAHVRVCRYACVQMYLCMCMHMQACTYVYNTYILCESACVRMQLCKCQSTLNFPSACLVNVVGSEWYSLIFKFTWHCPFLCSRILWIVVLSRLWWCARIGRSRQKRQDLINKQSCSYCVMVCICCLIVCRSFLIVFS